MLELYKSLANDHRELTNIPERLLFDDTWMVENHFCIRFIEPLCQSLQSNKIFSASITWKRLPITNSVSFIQWTCHNVLIINNQTIEGQKASFFLYKEEDYKVGVPKMVKRKYLLRSWIYINDKFTIHKTTSQRHHGVFVMGEVYSKNFPISIMSVDLFELAKRSCWKIRVNRLDKTHDIRILHICLCDNQEKNPNSIRLFADPVAIKTTEPSQS